MRKTEEIRKLLESFLEKEKLEIVSCREGNDPRGDWWIHIKDVKDEK